MVLQEKELETVVGGNIRNILLIGLGTIISFCIGVLESFFSKNC